MAIRKVISKTRVSKEDEVLEEIEVKEVQEEVSKAPVKRGCFFCQSKVSPSYTDLANLRRFLTDRAKILRRDRSGVCSKHQRLVAKNIKYARHLALLPFVPKV